MIMKMMTAAMAEETEIGLRWQRGPGSLWHCAGTRLQSTGTTLPGENCTYEVCRVILNLCKIQNSSVFTALYFFGNIQQLTSYVYALQELEQGGNPVEPWSRHLEPGVDDLELGGRISGHSGLQDDIIELV